MSLGIELLNLSTTQLCLLGIYLFFMFIGICRVTIVLYNLGLFHYLVYGIKILGVLIVTGIQYIVDELLNLAVSKEL